MGLGGPLVLKPYITRGRARLKQRPMLALVNRHSHMGDWPSLVPVHTFHLIKPGPQSSLLRLRQRQRRRWRSSSLLTGIAGSSGGAGSKGRAGARRFPGAGLWSANAGSSGCPCHSYR